MQLKRVDRRFQVHTDISLLKLLLSRLELEDGLCIVIRKITTQFYDEDTGLFRQRVDDITAPTMTTRTLTCEHVVLPGDMPSDVPAQAKASKSDKFDDYFKRAFLNSLEISGTVLHAALDAPKLAACKPGKAFTYEPGSDSSDNSESSGIDSSDEIIVDIFKKAKPPKSAPQDPPTHTAPPSCPGSSGDPGPHPSVMPVPPVPAAPAARHVRLPREKRRIPLGIFTLASCHRTNADGIKVQIGWGITCGRHIGCTKGVPNSKLTCKIAIGYTGRAKKGQPPPNVLNDDECIAAIKCWALRGLSIPKDQPGGQNAHIKIEALITNNL